MKLKIDPEFEKLKPPATDAQLRVLESLLLRDGCRDAIVVWNGIILDGTLRYRICERLNIPFHIYTEQLDSRENAMLWIINNELGRRHVGGFSAIESLLKLKGSLEKHAKLRGSKQEAADNTDLLRSSGKTYDKLGKIMGVGKIKIYQAGYIAQHGTLEQIARARAGGAENTVTGIYKEIREAEHNGNQN